MAKVRVKMNSAGARALLRSADVESDLLARARAIGSAAGVGYEASSQTGAGRARASVITADFAAIRDNARNNVLLKNLDRGR